MRSELIFRNLNLTTVSKQFSNVHKKIHKIKNALFEKYFIYFIAQHPKNN